MSDTSVDITGWMNQIAATWEDFHASFAGLSDEQMQEPGVAGDWSVRDVLAHVAVWDGESMNDLPDIAAGRRGHPGDDEEDTDTFNARKTDELRGMPLDAVRDLLAGSHRQLLDYLQGLGRDDIVPTSVEAFRARLGSDTWDHYPQHAASIRAFREARGW
jgi:uncharacterized protein (TIGR03083 family)